MTATTHPLTVAPLDIEVGDLALLPTKRADQQHLQMRFVEVVSWPRTGMAGNVSMVVKQVFTGVKMRATVGPDETVTVVR